jgi:hypothetical protein
MAQNQPVASGAAFSTLDSPPSTTAFSLTIFHARRIPRTKLISTSGFAIQWRGLAFETIVRAAIALGSRCTSLSHSVSSVRKVLARATVINCTFGAEYKCMTCMCFKVRPREYLLTTRVTCTRSFYYRGASSSRGWMVIRTAGHVFLPMTLPGGCHGVSRDLGNRD